MLNISNINKSYTDGESRQDVLKNLSYVFPNKGFFSILGKSGSGKTTLLNLIGGIDTFDSGEISLGNLNYSQLNNNDWNKVHTNIISFVFQEYNLLDQFTVIENLRFAVPGVKDSMIDDTLSRFDLLDKKDKYPNQLSGGEKQRIAIIRSFLKTSKIILVDEPTGNLDDETSIIIMDFLKELTKEKLVIMITHDKEVAERYSDAVLQLKKGELVCDISFDETSENINIDDISSLPFTLRIASKLAFKQMRKKLAKHFQYILMFSVTLFFLSLGFALLFVNEFSVAAHNLIDSNTLYYTYIPNYIDNTDESTYFNSLNSDIYPYYEAYRIHLEEYEERSSANSYISSLNGFMQYHNDIEIIQGNEPVASDEIVVSDYIAKALEVDFNVSNPIGYTIPNTTLVISGIYKTDYELYLDIFEMDTNFNYDDDINYSLKSIAKYKVDSVYSIMYTSSQFDYTNTFVYLRGHLPDLASDTTSTSVQILSIDHTDDIVYSSFNATIENLNDIYISTEVLSSLVQRDFNFDINSDTEFENYWADHEQELVEYAIDKELGLSQTLRIKDMIYPYDTMTIKGVYTDSRANKYEQTIQVNSSHYNRLFTSDYRYAITNRNASDLEEDMKSIYEKDYEYDGFNLRTIINFKEDTRPVITNIANGFSIILSLFSILLFTNLLSRDITSMNREIGLLRTLGIKMSSISRLFLVEIITLSGISVIIALLLHPIGLRVLNYTFGSGYDELIIVSFNIMTIVYLVFAIILIMLITIIVPFIKLSRLKLIDCIRKND
ncbi:MAG: ABC transporter ATP-binding protein/permease [Candidatus Izemoplasmataceae bacterium]